MVMRQSHEEAIFETHRYYRDWRSLTMIDRKENVKGCGAEGQIFKIYKGSITSKRKISAHNNAEQLMS